MAETSFLKSREGKSPANAQTFLDSAAFASTVVAKTVLPNVQQSQIKDTVQAQIDSALLGSISVSDAMQAACDEINTILGGN